MSSDSPRENDSTTPVDRRAAVRRLATIVGVGAGAVALPALTQPAEAKPGDAVRAGAKNDAGDAQTALQGSGSTPVLRVENTRSKSGPVGDSVDLISPQLELGAPVPGANRPQVPDVRGLPPGGVGIAGGIVMVGADLGRDTAFPVQVHTSAVGNLVVPIPLAAATVLDTATMSADQRAQLPAGAFDGAGRLAPGTRTPVSLRGLVNSEKFEQHVLACVSITAAGGDFSGAVNAHADDQLPGDVVVLSYAVLPPEVTANGQPFALPATASAIAPLDQVDRLWISVSTATHVKLQVSAVIVPDHSVLVEPAEPSAGLSDTARRGALQRQAVREMTASQPNAK
ncbi:hypothetical protein [Blastococcus sp. Marseille-P5729]|uniref:hypothetical protein n=1 Tax=Blastococcus sp. Marseille-P5729 TaxID=2086582 RepID=UPI000D106C0A|nr:hypothetical protein [Blastococcus sp. Marseille-P5729]